MTIKRIEVQIPEFLKGVLSKDLQENEVICEKCQGSGLAIADNVYGLKGEKGFNYKQQSITYCQYCYNGVRTKCEFCGELTQRGHIKQCVCEGYKEYKDKEEKKAELRLFLDATKMTYEEYIEEYLDYMIYDVNTDKYYEDLDALKNDYDSEGLELPKYVYGTSRITIGLDIDDFIESACDELYEDAYENLVGVEELHEAIDNFNLKNEKNTATYYPNYRVVIPL